MNDKINSIIQGTFEIDLVEVELKKEDTHITGKGVIYQKDESLQFKFFNHAKINEENKEEEFIKSINSTNKTQVLTEDDHYTLLGKDEYGNKYESKVFVSFIASEIITGKLYFELIKIGRTESGTKSNTIEVYINDNGPIPLNDSKNISILYGKSKSRTSDSVDDAWFFQVSDKYKIQVQRNNKYQKILIGTEGDIGEGEIEKLLDALRFVLGRYFNWFYINYNSGDKEKYYLTRLNISKNTIFNPPLKININYDVDNYEKLFNRYYAYLSNENEEAKRLNFFVRKSNIAGYAYLGALELVLATSIEGILKTFRIETNDNVKDDKTKADVNKVSKFLEIFEEDNEVRRRVGGTLRSILNYKSNDATDILKNLVIKGKLDKRFKKIYSDFRHPKAHAKVPDSNSITRLNELNEIIVLFYHLIFLQIGYTGEYTNYSTDEVEDFILTR